MNHVNYFNNKNEKAIAAKTHVKEMAQKFPESIANSIKKTKIYNEFEHFSEIRSTNRPIIEQTDSVSAVLKYATGNAKVCVLNFASYKTPGGMFYEGSSAQEESLCHESTLYNVISNERFIKDYYKPNRKALYRALYLNRALYSPDITFIRDDVVVCCDVLTCAAPNFTAANKYQHVSRAENALALRDRIRFVLDIMANEGVQTPILGAFGCGVFGQDAREVAETFRSCLTDFNYPFEKVIFAIIPGPNAEAFEEVFAK